MVRQSLAFAEEFILSLSKGHFFLLNLKLSRSRLRLAIADYRKVQEEAPPLSLFSPLSLERRGDQGERLV
jgi:hypothetical protein